MDYVTRQFINLAKKLRDDVRKSFSSLHNDLSRLSDGLKNLKDAVGTERQSYEKQRTIDHRITIADLQTQVPIRVQTEAKRSKIARVWGFAKGALEIAGILAAVIYAWVAYHQWQETIDATNFTARQTELSRKGLNETVKNFRVGERAYIFVVGIDPSVPLKEGENTLILTMRNMGRTPGRKLLVLSTAFIDGKAVLATKPIETSHGTIGDQPETGAMGLTLNTATARGIIDGPIRLEIRGKIKYSDIFADSHVTEFCGFYNRQRSKFAVCATGNDIQ
jgi:hypothetical protein